MTVATLTLQEAARIMREAVEDRSYQLLPLGEDGTFSSDREMSLHVARHTAGQRLLDATGNVAAVKSLLGHQSIQTTVDTYVDWDAERLAASLLEVFRGD